MLKRYRVYREHKYVLGFLAELEQFIATMDFKSNTQLEQLADKIDRFIALMQGHAEHEDNVIHQLLKDKDSQVQTSVDDKLTFLKDILEAQNDH